MFMGIRRHLLHRSWFYVPAEQFVIFKIDRDEVSYQARVLPMSVGGPNHAQPLHPQFTEVLNEQMRHKFRDFRFEWFADDEEGMVMV